MMMSEWPNNPSWSALREGFEFKGKDYFDEDSGFKAVTSVLELESIKLPSGRLIVAEPGDLSERNTFPHTSDDKRYYPVPLGEHRVFLTQAKVFWSEKNTDIRNAYVSIVFAQKSEKIRRLLVPTIENQPPLEKLPAGEFYDVSVDGGLVCFVDEQILLSGMPVFQKTKEYGDNWQDFFFDQQRKNQWYTDAQGLSDQEFFYGILPESNEKTLIVHSGWGDGGFPVIGGFDENDQLISIHVDFFVCPTDLPHEPELE